MDRQGWRGYIREAQARYQAVVPEKKKIIQIVEFELFTAATMNIIVSCVLMPCGLIDMCIQWDCGLRFLDLRVLLPHSCVPA